MRPQENTAVAFHKWRPERYGNPDDPGGWELVLADAGTFKHGDGSEMRKECRVAAIDSTRAWRLGRTDGLGYCNTHGQWVLGRSRVTRAVPYF